MVSNRSESGQLSLPILAVLFLFGMFICLHARRSWATYRDMRLDITADLVALSASRTQAQNLNTLATMEDASNGLFQKLQIGPTDVARMSMTSFGKFNRYKKMMKGLDQKFIWDVMNAARITAKANGAKNLPVPLMKDHLGHLLKWKVVTIQLFLKSVVPAPIPPIATEAYLVRTWKPTVTQAQPIHKQKWKVCEEGTCKTGKAILWLDLRLIPLGNNGGFPPYDPGFLGGMGVQCMLPHFTSRQLSKNTR